MAQVSEPGQNEEDEDEDAMNGGCQDSKSIESTIYQRSRAGEFGVTCSSSWEEGKGLKTADDSIGWGFDHPHHINSSYASKYFCHQHYHLDHHPNPVRVVDTLVK
ncbi:hypothetical protein ABKV19_007461 [Rosa sericea]